MVIETDARRFIVDAIAIEALITQFEQDHKKGGIVLLQTNKDYNELRGKFIAKICEINSVANILGKGRDDFTVEILLRAEAISRSA
jgi:hypothetical protein